MGKTKQAKEKKFDRNVEISAPILDPEIIKAIHTPPKGQIDIKHGGFKALLSDLNSQDSIDELTPLNNNHVPSYIGISCAVSGYSNYSSYSKKSASQAQETSKTMHTSATPDRSQTASPFRSEQHQIHHITIDKNNIHSADEERKELTEKLTASATERNRRSPSPCIPPTEDDRHHGTYVGARYCPLPPPSKLVNKHIPLLGIDDEKDPDESAAEEESEKKVEQRIASLYGGDFVEDWRESMQHKTKKELPEDQQANQQQSLITPKDLVTLKPTPPPAANEKAAEQEVDIPTPDIKVLASVEKQFLNKLLTDENPPVPSQSTVHVTTKTEHKTISPSPAQAKDEPKQKAEETPRQQQKSQLPPSPQPPVQQQQEVSPSPPPPPISPDSGKNHSFAEEEPVERIPIAHQSDVGEEHIEYEIRASSPVDNNSSPTKIPHHQGALVDEAEPEQEAVSLESQHVVLAEQKLVSFSPEPAVATATAAVVTAAANVEEHHEEVKALIGEAREELGEVVAALDGSSEKVASPTSDASSANYDGRYYLNLLDKEKSFILEQVAQAEAVLESSEADLDEDTLGRIRSAIGKANLLINKKCNQFKELCEANVNKGADEQYATLNDDLAGFWDMLSIQVNDVRNSFQTLWDAKKTSWKSNNNNNNENLNVQAPGENAAGHLDDDGDDNDDTRSDRLKEKAASSGVTGKASKLSPQKDQKRRERLHEHINQMKMQSQAAAAAVESSGESLLDDVEAIATSASSKLIEGAVGAVETSEVGELVSSLDADHEVTHQSFGEEAEEQLFSLMGGVVDGSGNDIDKTSDAQPSAEQAAERTGASSADSAKVDLVDLTG